MENTARTKKRQACAIMLAAVLVVSVAIFIIFQVMGNEDTKTEVITVSTLEKILTY